MKQSNVIVSIATHEGNGYVCQSCGNRTSRSSISTSKQSKWLIQQCEEYESSFVSSSEKSCSEDADPEDCQDSEDEVGINATDYPKG